MDSELMISAMAIENHSYKDHHLPAEYLNVRLCALVSLIGGPATCHQRISESTIMLDKGNMYMMRVDNPLP
jgi:hypothetical protein